jgi:RNA polymerase sigma-70 factor (ECF subfamily)
MLSVTTEPDHEAGALAQQEPILTTENAKQMTANQADPTFEDLLERVARQQDRQAFIALFEHYAPRIKGFFIKGGLSADIADELAQETMLTVWHKAATYNPAISNANTWIYTVARNKRIDYFRRRGRPEPDHNDPLMAPDEPPAPDQALSQSQDNEALAAAIRELPDEQADIIRQSYFEDKTQADIAAETGLPLGTVKSRIRLALERLRHHLGGNLS